LEVYPHPALLSLMARRMRVPYKVSKARKYWPGASADQRIKKLLAEFARIASALRLYFSEIGIEIPRVGTITNLSRLKRYEDALDALVCAWVGAEHLAGRTVALGDETAAIWCPTDVVLSRSQVGFLASQKKSGALDR
jgi:predicted RNase H-like nuclease